MFVVVLQGYILPTLGLLAYLKPDGTYYPNPWLDEPTATSVPSFETDSSPPETPEQVGQNLQLSAQDSQLSSDSNPQQLLAAASAKLSQRSTAELAHATASHAPHGAAPAGTAASQQVHTSTSSLEELQLNWGQGYQQALLQSATAPGDQITSAWQPLPSHVMADPSSASADRPGLCRRCQL